MEHKSAHLCAFAFLMGFVAITGASSRSAASKTADSPAADTAVAALAADVDGDGRPDLIAVQRAGARGIVTVHRALDRSIVGDSHYFERGASEDLDVAPDFAAAGDLDGDGFNDVVVGTRGVAELTVLLGDGQGRFDRKRSIPLGGGLTALAAGEVNRIDGLVDLVAGIEDGGTASLVVLESPSGALEAEPERIDLPGVAHGIVLGRFGGTSVGDAVAYSDGELLLVRGRDRKLATPSAEHGAPTLQQWPLEERIVSLAASGSDLAIRGTDGRVRTVHVPGRDEPGGPRVLEIKEVAGEDSPAAFRMRVDADGIDDRVVLGPGPGAVTVLPGAVAATFIVNSTGDGADAVPGDGICADGSTVCTLRAAIEEANAAAGADTITFSIGAGTPTIAPLTELPAISAPVTIQGNTGGATRIQLNGASVGAGSNGLRLISGSSGSLLRSFVINRFTGAGAGIRIESDSNTVEDCWIGLDSLGGVSVAGNAGGGIVLSGATATNNLIGGTAAATRNTISHNGANGIQLQAGASDNRVEGNYIGTNPGTNIASANSGDGIAVLGAAKNNTIGGSSSSPGTGRGNVISGNSGDGIDVSGAGTTGNLIQGNLIGTNGAGATAIGNSQNGVLIQAGAATNTIGGTTDPLRNVISGNNFATSDGIELNGSGVTDTNVFGNYLGLSAGGGVALPNGEDGILVSQGAQNNVIGAASPTPGTAGGNVISGNNRNGVRVEGASTSGMLLQGNIIGLNNNGSTILKNVADGVSIDAATNTTIGGIAVTQRNVISGNDGTLSRGIFVGSGANSTTVQSNFIGTDITGTYDLGNGGQGVYFSDSLGTGIAGIVVGGLTSVPGTVPGNVISGNGRSGIEISGSTIAAGTIQGNLIGLNASGSGAVGNLTGITLNLGAHGVLIGGTTTTARNVISGNTTGISTSTSVDAGATIQGNYIGTNIGGTVAVGNMTGLLLGRNVTIGGASFPLGAPPGNLISGNVVGISIVGSASTVRGNIVGATPDGLAALPNGKGITFRSPSTNGNTVGGTGAGERNLISGNTQWGVECEKCGLNSLIGNWIGVSLSQRALPNGIGVLYGDASQFDASLLVTGGTSPGSGNVISGNLGAGIKVTDNNHAGGSGILGNLIGVAPDGVTPLGNGSHGIEAIGSSIPPIGGTVGLTPGACTGACNDIRFNHGDGISFLFSSARASIRGNRISDNDGLGIDLTSEGVTLNEQGETLRPTNFPVVTNSSFDGVDTTISGTLSSTASTTFSIDVFRGASDPSGYGEGNVYLGTVACSTNASGVGLWSLVVAGAVSGITATATSPANETSEFAMNFVDSDSDTFADGSDNCPALFNPGQIDQDFDGAGDDCDCAPSDASAFAIPAEVTGGPTPTNKYTFTWTNVNAGSATIYDFLRGEIPALPVNGGATETCINHFSGSPGIDNTTPLPGQMFWYLVRARNSCGASSYGFASSGIERVSGACQ